MIGKPQVKRKLGHEVQIYVCRFNVILDLSISGCNILKLFKHDLTGKGHEFGLKSWAKATLLTLLAIYIN